MPCVYSGNLWVVTQSPHLVLRHQSTSTFTIPFQALREQKQSSSSLYPHHHDYEMSPQLCSLTSLAGSWGLSVPLRTKAVTKQNKILGNAYVWMNITETQNRLDQIQIYYGTQQKHLAQCSKIQSRIQALSILQSGHCLAMAAVPWAPHKKSQKRKKWLQQSLAYVSGQHWRHLSIPTSNMDWNSEILAF